MFAQWIARIEPAQGRARIRVALNTLAMIALIIWLDLNTDPDTLASTLFMLPVLYATLRLSAGAGWLALLLATASNGALDLYFNRIHGWAPSLTNSLLRIATGLVVCKLVGELHAALRREVHLAGTDALTGLANSRTFWERLDFTLAHSRRNRRPFTLAFIDLDYFKQVNDKYGHDAGDALLKAVATTLAAHLRADDLCARIGGDEFAVILPDTDEIAAHSTLNRLLAQLGAILKPGWNAGATMGAMTFLAAPDDAQAALKLADALLYQGKKNGRGRVICDRWPDVPEREPQGEAASGNTMAAIASGLE